MVHTTSYSLSIEKIDCYAHAIVGGDHFDLDHLVKAFESISKYCIQHELAKVLIEDRIPVEWELRDMELIASRAAPMFKGLKTAIYVHLDSKQFISHFGETVAQSRGLDLAVFINVDAAKHWLEEN